MPKKKKKAKGLTPEQVAAQNRKNLDYAMEKNPMLQFGDIMANSNQMMGGMLGNALPIMQGMMDMGSSATGQSAPNMMDILAQLQPPQQQPQPGQPQPQLQQPQPQPSNPYNLTPEQMAAMQQYTRGPGRGIV